MTLLATVDALDVEDGQILHPAPGSDGVVIAHDVDEHGWETFQLGNGHLYSAHYDKPVEVVLTQDVQADQIAAGDLIVRDDRIVRVVDTVHALGDVFLRWASDERDSDGIPVITGLTHVRARHVPTVRVRLIDRPESLTEVAW